MSLELDAIVFDILGTMVEEPAGIQAAIRSVLPRSDETEVRRLEAVWNAHVEDEQEAIVTGARPFATSETLSREAAAAVASRSRIPLSAEQVLALATASEELTPWPDSVAGLEHIAGLLPVIGLSNASRGALARINAHAGLRWHQVLSAEDAGTYKPDPDIYRLAADTIGSAPDRLLMVAAHAWDLRGAQSVGMRTAYVQRPVGDPPGPSDTFDLHASTLGELASTLSATRLRALT